MDENAKKLLSARISDLAEEAERGYVTNTVFLDPSEVYFAEKYLRQIGVTERCVFYGGYNDAERKCLFFLPEYYESMLSAENRGYNEALVPEIRETVTAVSIKGSGYKTLSHRDYLGALLNMGIERSAIGDICVTGEHEAVVFALPRVAELILSLCERIGADKVKVSKLDINADFTYERKTKSISDTVASDRADCVIAALAGESREKAKAIINSGLVERNYSQCTKSDERISNGDVISIRGTGKFVICDITEETKKGRIRLSAKKFI